MNSRTSTTFSNQIQASARAGDFDTQAGLALLMQDVGVIQSLLATDWNRSITQKLVTFWCHQLDKLPKVHSQVKETDRVVVSAFRKEGDAETVYAMVTFFAKQGTFDKFPWNPNGTLCQLEFQYSKRRRNGYIDNTERFFRRPG